MGRFRRNPYRTLFSETAIIGVLLAVLLILGQVDARLARQMTADASTDSSPSSSSKSTASTAGSGSSDSTRNSFEAKAERLFRGIRPRLERLIEAKRYGVALRLLTDLPASIRETSIWKEEIEPELATLRKRKAVADSYNGALTKLRRLVDRSELAAARRVVEEYPYKESDGYRTLQRILNDALDRSRITTVYTGEQWSGGTDDEQARGEEGATDDSEETAEPEEGAESGESEAEEWTPPELITTRARGWQIESEYDRDFNRALVPQLAFLTRMHCRLFGRPLPTDEDDPRRLRIFRKPEDARLAARNAPGGIIVAGGGDGLELRVLFEAARGLFDEIRPAKISFPAWLEPGIVHYMVMFRPSDEEGLQLRKWVDAYHASFMRLARTDRLLPPGVLADLPADRFRGGYGGASPSPEVVQAWGMTYFLVHSVACRKNGLRRRFVLSARRLASGERVGNFLPKPGDKKLRIFTEWWADFVTWGDVLRYPIEIRPSDGWQTVQLPRLVILTEHKDPEFPRQVSNCFQVLFDEYHRFYQEVLGLHEKNIYRCRIRLFASKESFDEHNEKSGKAGQRQHWDPGANEVVMYNESGEIEENLPTLYHEFSHRFSQIYLPNIRTWTNEGLATYLGGTRRRLTHFDYGNVAGSLAVTRAAIEDGSALPLKKLTELTYDEFHDSPDESLHYSQSCSLIHFILHQRGERADPKRTRKFFQEAAVGRDDWKTLEDLFGRPIEEIEAAWRHHVKTWR